MRATATGLDPDIQRRGNTSAREFLPTPSQAGASFSGGTVEWVLCGRTVYEPASRPVCIPMNVGFTGVTEARGRAFAAALQQPEFAWRGYVQATRSPYYGRCPDRRCSPG
jgi:hypothetical protein